MLRTAETAAAAGRGASRCGNKRGTRAHTLTHVDTGRRIRALADTVVCVAEAAAVCTYIRMC